MSDFYRVRRTTIKDTTALLAFFVGFAWSGALAWPFLTAQVDRGDMIKGLAYFLGVVLATAMITGWLGLEAGAALGGVWEKYHRKRRASRPATEAPEPPSMRGTVASSDERRTRVVPAHDIATISYNDRPIDPASFIHLAQRVASMSYDADRVRDALSRTTNIGAWDGSRLVGTVRVLSDGYLFSTVTEIMVDPEYQGIGIGSALMQRALDAAPREQLLISPPRATARFFEHIGCEQEPAGFVLRKRALTRTT